MYRNFKADLGHAGTVLAGVVLRRGGQQGAQ